ncbi:uncharacterized protein LOC105206644 isoform X2 [Solenopsis invicta]|nr:uncharacterized protein LOC105206644 isoform X2 [Solenopsis invicta]
MDDQKYMVCEFPNEENSIAIGYLKWLEDKFTVTELDDIIKHETLVKVRWPKDCDIGPTTAMKKKLTNCQWEVVVTKLCAHGEWVKMCEIRDNLEKYGIIELDKHDRKQFTRKQTTDIDKSKVKETKKSAVSKQKKCTLNVKKGKNLLKQYKHNKQKYSSQSEYVDDDNECNEENDKSPVHKQSKSQLADTIIVLQEENRRLRRDNERLRRLRSVNEDLPKMDKMMKDLMTNLESVTLTTKSFNRQIDELQQKVQASSNCIIKRKRSNTPPAVTLDSDPIWINKLDLPNNKLKSSATDASPTSIVQNRELDLSDKLKLSEKSATEFRESALLRESTSLTSGHNLVSQNLETSEDFPDTLDVATKTVNVHDLEHVHESNHATDKMKSSDDHQSNAIHKHKDNKTVNLGGPIPCIVNSTRLSLCNHTSVSKLICEMMSLLFTKEELATSSLTGTVANFHCEKGIAAKKKLDTVKIEAMKAYVKNKFPFEKDFEKIFRKAVQQKCNNAVPRNRGLIIKKSAAIIKNILYISIEIYRSY